MGQSVEFFRPDEKNWNRLTVNFVVELLSWESGPDPDAGWTGHLV